MPANFSTSRPSITNSALPFLVSFGGIKSYSSWPMRKSRTYPEPLAQLLLLPGLLQVAYANHDLFSLSDHDMALLDKSVRRPEIAWYAPVQGEDGPDCESSAKRQRCTGRIVRRRQIVKTPSSMLAGGSGRPPDEEVTLSGGHLASLFGSFC